MRSFLLLLIALVFAGGFAFWAVTQPNQKIKRQPLEKPGFKLKSPTEYLKRQRIESGREVTYDPKPRVEVVDARAGKYELRWIGYDGKEKVIAYQSPDAIDVVVSGSVEKSADGSYVYSYIVDILPSSATYLYSFDLQNFSDDARPIEINGMATTLADVRLIGKLRHLPHDGKPKNLEKLLIIGEMSNDIHRFKDGNWIAFGTLPDFEQAVSPGRKLQLRIVSKGAPGLVGCSATGGSRTMKGAGEHMPSELENVLPGYEVLPSGHTVGPVASLNSLSQPERVSYLLDKMVQFEKLGWITPAARSWYEKNLRNDLASVLSRAHKDLASEQISSEVFAMIQVLKQ